MDDILEIPETETETELITESVTEPLEAESPKDYSSDLDEIKSLLRDLNKETSVTSDTGNAEVLDLLESINKEVKSVSISSQNIQTISIPIMCGIGIVIGCICGLIFTNFFRG